MLTKKQLEARRKLKPSARAVLKWLKHSGEYGCDTHDLMNIEYEDANGTYRRGCARYGARICELRRAGYRIQMFIEGGQGQYFLSGR